MFFEVISIQLHLIPLIKKFLNINEMSAETTFKCLNTLNAIHTLINIF